MLTSTKGQDPTLLEILYMLRLGIHNRYLMVRVCPMPIAFKDTQFPLGGENSDKVYNLQVVVVFEWPGQASLRSPTEIPTDIVHPERVV